MMNKSSFDRISFVYDLLAGLVFGSSIIRSQQYFFSEVEKCSNILILGGGTGKAFNKLVIDKHATITYVDASAQMVKLAQLKLARYQRQVCFIVGTENDIPDAKFDCIITNFYLDLFGDSEIEGVINRIRKHCAPKCKWIATDFIDDRFWKKISIRLMYWFFRVTTNLSTNRLPRWLAALKKNDFEKKLEADFYSGFIKTVLLVDVSEEPHPSQVAE